MLFRHWRHQRELDRIHKDYEKKREALRQKKGASGNDFAELDYLEHEDIRDAQDHMDFVESNRLREQLRALDMELPEGSDDSMWARDDSGEFVWLSSKGRAQVRRMVQEEQGRRLDLRVKQIGVWLPLITAVTGLLGTAIGIISVLYKR